MIGCLPAKKNRIEFCSEKGFIFQVSLSLSFSPFLLQRTRMSVSPTSTSPPPSDAASSPELAFGDSAEPSPAGSPVVERPATPVRPTTPQGGFVPASNALRLKRPTDAYPQPQPIPSLRVDLRVQNGPANLPPERRMLRHLKRIKARNLSHPNSTLLNCSYVFFKTLLNLDSLLLHHHLQPFSFSFCHSA